MVPEGIGNVGYVRALVCAGLTLVAAFALGAWWGGRQPAAFPKGIFREKAHAKTLMIGCQDPRCQCMMEVFRAKNGLQSCELIYLAGGAKILLDPDTRKPALRSIELAATKHGVKDVILWGHVDCAANGGNDMFLDDAAQIALGQQQCREAMAIIRDELPHLNLDLSGRIATNDGVEEVLLNKAAPLAELQLHRAW